jgi:tRNA-binding protein
MEIDFGPLGMRTSSAQLTALYTPEELIGRQVLAVVNFPPRRIAGVQSQVLVLGVTDDDGAVILLSTEREAPLGSRVH